MKNHFYTSYAGNKRNEVERIYETINFDNIDTIVEPYCGSCALSYYIWSLNKDKNYKYVLNDADPYLIPIFKSIIEGTYEELENSVNEIRERVYSKVYDNFDEAKKIYLSYFKSDNLAGRLFCKKYMKLREGMMPTGRDLPRLKKEFKFSDYPIFYFLRDADIELHNDDANRIINKYDNSNAFIFLDPPYLGSCNNFYARGADKELENAYLPLYEKGLKNYNCKILLCHELNWFFRLMFKEYINEDEKYSKRYEINLGSNYKRKNDTNHICIKNF